LSARPFGQFSTAHSNGTNKVIDTPCTSLLSSPVYIEFHPRRDAAHDDSPISLESFNPCTFNSFPTLVAQWTPATLSFSIVSGLFPLQWGCIPLYPERFVRRVFSSISRRPSHFSSTTYKMLFQQPLCFDNHPFSWGVYPPSRAECLSRWFAAQSSARCRGSISDESWKEAEVSRRRRTVAGPAWAETFPPQPSRRERSSA
jgi:hypothetical protein